MDCIKVAIRNKQFYYYYYKSKKILNLNCVQNWTKVTCSPKKYIAVETSRPESRNSSIFCVINISKYIDSKSILSPSAVILFFQRRCGLRIILSAGVVLLNIKKKTVKVFTFAVSDVETGTERRVCLTEMAGRTNGREIVFILEKIWKEINYVST